MSAHLGSAAERSGVLDAQVFEWLEADFDLRAVEAVPVEGVDREATRWRVRDVTGRDLAVTWTSGGTVASLAVPCALAHAAPGPLSRRAVALLVDATP